MKNKLFIGIDLGTTNTTCAAIIVKSDGLVEEVVIPILQAYLKVDGSVTLETKNILSSSVFIKENSSKVFCGGIDAQYQNFEYVPVRGIKTKLSDDFWFLEVNGTKLSPSGVSAIILKTVYDSIVSYLNSAKIKVDFKNDVKIIITIPASFSSKMRKATVEAALMAGFFEEQLSLLDEPVAAIVSGYNVANKDFNIAIPYQKPIMIYDMGGGTVDVSIVSINKETKSVTIVSSSRYNELGGEDINLELASLILYKLKLDEDLKAVIDSQMVDGNITTVFANNLLNYAEGLKIKINDVIDQDFPGTNSVKAISQMSNLPNFNIRLQDLFLDNDSEITLNLSEIIKVLLPLISKDLRNTNRNIFNPIEQALKMAKLNQVNIAKVYGVGGSSQFSLISKELKNGISDIEYSLDAVFSVSIGAAKFAFLKQVENWKILERTNDKIFIRRDGMPPLEVLANDLPIPSDKIEPANEMTGISTIYFDPGTDVVELEFYQGVSIADSGLSTLYKAVINLEDTLIERGRISKIVGQINQNKMFHFLIEISDGNSVVHQEKIEFNQNFQNSRSAKSELSNLSINDYGIVN